MSYGWMQSRLQQLQGFSMVLSMYMGISTVRLMYTGASTIFSMQMGCSIIFSMQTGFSTIFSTSTTRSMQTGTSMCFSTKTGTSLRMGAPADLESYSTFSSILFSSLGTICASSIAFLFSLLTDKRSASLPTVSSQNEICSSMMTSASERDYIFFCSRLMSSLWLARVYRW